MSDFREQRVCIKFCQKIGDSTAETFEKLVIAFRNNVLCLTETFEWLTKFQNRRSLVEDFCCINS